MVVPDNLGKCRTRVVDVNLMGTLHFTHRSAGSQTKPWVNGTVELLNVDVLSALRAMLAELDFGSQDWTTVIESVASVLMKHRFRAS